MTDGDAPETADRHVEAVREVATDGVDFDGLVVEADGEGYRVAAGDDGPTAPDDERMVAGGDLATALEAHAAHVTNWYFWHATAPQKPDRWAFLRWLERADERSVSERYAALEEGVVTTWGQLRIEATVAGDGTRQYDLRHEDDAGASGLTAYADPVDARDVARRDDRGRYRPLKTAPTLDTGWQFPSLDAADLVTAIDYLYPATIANWHREREGDLDVSHWRETMDRQTGMYGLIKTWDRGEGHEHVDWVAEACCADSQCLKRREWEYDADTDLDVDGGDGAFPCREPCSLVVSAARKWTKLESEEPRTYEFELTPSEKEQLERIVGAVADGEADEIREADVSDGANRYRARFLRAKLFDDGGNLDSVETGE